MNLKDEVCEYDELCMLDAVQGKPLDQLVKMKQSIRNLSFNQNVYPAHTMHTTTPPTCIFKPSRALIRQVIDALVMRRPGETDFDIFMKFGLMET